MAVEHVFIRPLPAVEHVVHVFVRPILVTVEYVHVFIRPVPVYMFSLGLYRQ